nr:extracellular solute-binding protein [Schwartzia sp. (in: firmicutes)]
ESLADKKRQPEADLVLADSRVMREAARKGAFVPYLSEGTDSMADAFKDQEGAWTGVWYDPIVFCMNSDYLRTMPHIPETWAEFAAYPDMRVGMTDFLAADAASNLYFTMVSVYGETEVLRQLSALHPKVVQYVKFLSTPVRMTGMGEVDAAVAVQSETLRYITGGYPIRIVYPTDGTAYMLTGAGLLRSDRPVAQEFIEWLLSDGAQMTLQRENVFFVPTNTGTLAYKQLAGKNIALFDKKDNFTPSERSALLDHWLQNVRFK